MFDFKKMKAPELEAQVALYRGLKDSEENDIVVPEAFQNNAARIAFLEEAVDKYGIAHTVTAEDLANNPDLVAEGVVEGEVVLLPKPIEAPVKPAKAEKPSKPSSGAAKPGKAPQGASQGASEGTEILIFRGREVISCENKVVNGRLYREVVTATDTQLLSEEDFNKEVSVKKA